MSRHIISDQIIPPGEPWSGIVTKGRHLRIVDREGKQAVDFLCYNLHDREERYFAPNTLKAAGTISLTKGHVLYSDQAQPLFTIVEDTYGSHDTIGGACSAPSNFMLYGVHDCPGCRENFLKALAPHGWVDATSFPTSTSSCAYRSKAVAAPPSRALIRHQVAMSSCAPRWTCWR